ncbi:hypothetical protein L7F22_030535 [Adiantum nelumboides]|nr:hypothetical protein [Adiantum nelumboides]
MVTESDIASIGTTTIAKTSAVPKQAKKGTQDANPSRKAEIIDVTDLIELPTKEQIDNVHNEVVNTINTVYHCAIQHDEIIDKMMLQIADISRTTMQAAATLKHNMQGTVDPALAGFIAIHDKERIKETEDQLQDRQNTLDEQQA